ncbi:MAG: UDP-glucoronosyl and UDP-glucosyl transferase, partial [Eubacteriales bacterium]
MKVLIAPMAVIMETSGPATRAAQIAHGLLEAGHEPAFCAALDGNYNEVPGVANFNCPIPSPFGLPMFLGRGMFRFAQAMGAPQRQTVHSYEQVLFFAGNLSKTYFSRDVEAIRQAICSFRPDVVYAEFRLTAIVAAKLEKVLVATGFSFPV